MIEVTLAQPVRIEAVDPEILVVAGCALGFVAPQQPPHVLHVEDGTEMATHGVQSDDLLIRIDGCDTHTMAQEEVAKHLDTASHLTFDRPKVPAEADEDAEEHSEGDSHAVNASHLAA